jgi:mono/diheme cytochrome c family protein
MITTHAALQSIPVPPEPPASPESLERGKATYAQACAACHGALGKGDGRQVMIDNLGYPVKPRDLTAGIFKGSSESRDLYHRIVAGLPGSPMPSYAGVYSDDQLWDLIHYVQSLVPPGVEDRVRLRPVAIRARRIKGRVPEEPSDDAWAAVSAIDVALTPLWWRDQRVEGVQAQALHNGRELAVRLSWDDPTRDDSTLTPQAFSDGAAIQFSTEADPPFFGMGDAAGAVYIWHWKASWQEDLASHRDIETAYPNAAVDWYSGQRDYRHGEPFEVSQAATASQDPEFMSGWGAGNPLSTPQRTSAAEEAVAKGLGTLTSRHPRLQQAAANGLWREGRWQVVLRRPFDFGHGGVPSGGEGRRPLAPSGETELTMRPGQLVRVAFAVWDGHAADRNGQKSVSIWNTLHLER